MDAADVETLLRRGVRLGTLDSAALAASLAEESDFEETDDEKAVRGSWCLSGHWCVCCWSEVLSHPGLADHLPA